MGGVWSRQILRGGQTVSVRAGAFSGVCVDITMRQQGVLGLLRLMRPHPPPGLQSLQVRHLLPQEQNPLFLQRGLDLRQSYQGPRHLQVSRHLQTQ